MRQIKRAFGNRPAFDILVTLQVVRRPLIFRLGGRHPRLRLRDFGFADFHLRLRFIQLAFRRRQIRAGLGRFRFVITRINFHQHVARLDLLIVLNEQLRDLSRHARTHQRDITVNERVVSGFIGRDEKEIIKNYRDENR